MADPVTLKNLAVDAFARTPRLIVPSTPFAALFVMSVGVLIWAAPVLPEGGAGFIGFSALFFGTLYAYSLFSASMYRAVLPAKTGLLASAWKLSLAWILVIVIASIVGSIVVLFFSLIGASLGAGAGEPGQNITDMTAQMRENGTFWPLFLVFLATLFGLFWFAARLTTFAAASATRGTVHVFRTWFWTKGIFAALGPAVFLFVLVPVIIAFWFAATLSSATLTGTNPTLQPVLAGLIGVICHLPAAYLGHGFAASLFERLAPERDDNATD
jgi:hypothetical protein